MKTTSVNNQYRKETRIQHPIRDPLHFVYWGVGNHSPDQRRQLLVHTHACTGWPTHVQQRAPQIRISAQPALGSVGYQLVCLLG